MRKSLLNIAWISLVAASTLRAAATEFNFKDPKGVNSIVFILDSTLEPIMGVAAGITGSMSFDPENPKATTGKLSVPTKALHTENKGMKETLHGPDWLDADKNPSIDFAFKKVTDARNSGDAHELTVVGDLTIKGITKEITVPVKITHLPGKMSERGGRSKGDLLVVRSNFVINRPDFKIKPDMDGKVVATEIEVRVSIAGFAPSK